MPTVLHPAQIWNMDLTEQTLHSVDFTRGDGLYTLFGFECYVIFFVWKVFCNTCCLVVAGWTCQDAAEWRPGPLVRTLAGTRCRWWQEKKLLWPGLSLLYPWNISVSVNWMCAYFSWVHRLSTDDLPEDILLDQHLTKDSYSVVGNFSIRGTSELVCYY